MTVIRTYPSLAAARQARDLLLQHGIGADILDEESAVNDPAGAMDVRLAVADEEVDTAMDALGPADAGQGVMASALPHRHRAKKRPTVLFFVLLAIALLALAFHSDLTKKSPLAGKVITHDRNHDGKPDVRIEYGSRGRIESFYDENFDGVWDHHVISVDGVIQSSESDTDFDGKYDWQHIYEDGLMIRRECRKGGQGPVLYRGEYEFGVQKSAVVDTDGDGHMDLRLEYDPYGRIVRQVSLR